MSHGLHSFLVRAAKHSWQRRATRTGRCYAYSRPVSRRCCSSIPHGKQRITVELYRQLIRWCHYTEEDIPLSSFVPPIYLHPPQISEGALLSLVEADQQVNGQVGNLKVIPSMFPLNTKFETQKLCCPIRNSADLRLFFRAVFRLNATATGPEIQKKQVSLAFEALRSLNELTKTLESSKDTRMARIDRKNVKFRVGQVVKHNVELWRGVIVGWEKPETKSGLDSDLATTSLTTKTYQTLRTPDQVTYQVILDAGDAHLRNSQRRDMGNMATAEVHESDVSLVENESLCRLRSMFTSEHFAYYDSKSMTFVPNERKAYEYPYDMLPAEELGYRTDADEAALAVVSGVQELASELITIVLRGNPSREPRELKLLAFFLDKLTTISSGDVIPTKESLYLTPVPPVKLATMHLRQLHNLVVAIGELLWQRRKSTESDRTIKFALGDVVQHRVFGFRGVVVAWDPEPAVDVSRWDGLQHITNPEKYPFYYIIPDQNDCIEAFGGERQSRYVCEENLDICPLDRRDIEVDLEPEWSLDGSSQTFMPPADLKFKYGGDIQDDGLTERCLKEINDEISRKFVSARDGTKSLHDTAVGLSSDNLFELLRAAECMDDGVMVSETLKEMWKSHTNCDLRWRLDFAVAKMLNGNTQEATSSLVELTEEDPDYAEAWNKLSTCEFMLGNLDSSLESGQKTLDLIPTHYQALNGMGLVHYQRNNIPSARDCFQKSLALDPWSPVSSRLATCLDDLSSLKESAVEGDSKA